MARYLLDLTRSLSRVDLSTPTGVDRVEREYLVRVLETKDPLFLVLAANEFFLFGKNAAAGLLGRLEGRVDWDRPKGADLLRFKASVRARGARSYLRANCIASARSAEALFKNQDLLGVTYLNVGHSNLKEDTLAPLRRRGAKAYIMVHDLIPLSHPDTTRPGIPGQFLKKMQAVAQHHDLILCNSRATERDVRRAFKQWDIPARTRVAYLGVTPMKGKWSPTPDPYFVALGTIEPRKNHALLLDVWDRLPTPKPQLRIIGRRGWNNRAVFKKLDQGVQGVTELGGLTDAEVTKHLLGARALLFPSLAEGFGLPALEALALGVPIVCSKLPVFTELLPQTTVLLNPYATKEWAQTVLAFTTTSVNHAKKTARTGHSVKIPTWETHFRHVLSG